MLDGVGIRSNKCEQHNMYLTISLDDLGIAYREFMMDCHRIVAIVLLRLNMRRIAHTLQPDGGLRLTPSLVRPE